MRTRFMTTWMIAASLLVSGQALTQPAQTQISDFQPGQVLRARELNAIVRRLNLNTNALSRENGATYPVDCSSGTIAEAMAQAQPGDTITITGTCNETVEVNKDGITLDGEGTAIIDGGGADVPVIAVYGQRNVVIKGLTVQNGRRGVLADRGAAVWLEDVIARGNGAGISIHGNSSATFAGAVMANDNKIESGIDLLQSTAWSEDASLIQANNNAEDGIALSRGAQMFLFGVSRIEVNQNGGFNGVLCYLDSSLSIASTGSTTFQVAGNEGFGIWIASHASLVLEGVDLAVSGNGGNGLNIGSTSTLETFGDYSYGDITVPAGSAVIDNNEGSGISLSRNSHAGFFSPVTISNNGGDGISAWNDADINLTEATFSGNGGDDIALSLGSRLGWGGDTSSITMSCDDSVLTYNGAACPVTAVPDDSDQ